MLGSSTTLCESCGEDFNEPTWLVSDLLALGFLGVLLQERKQTADDLLEPRELQAVAKDEDGYQNVRLVPQHGGGGGAVHVEQLHPQAAHADDPQGEEGHRHRHTVVQVERRALEAVCTKKVPPIDEGRGGLKQQETERYVVAGPVDRGVAPGDAGQRVVANVHWHAAPHVAVVHEGHQVGQQKGEEDVDAARRRRRHRVVVPRLPRDRPKASLEASHHRKYADKDAMHEGQD
mmetsp:Transcript_23888/g.48551  ORF Transcript_23888/g.48551 Transcript_23888/m.48551 type:complete len:233 (+) Transcript_23888:208-906(+)